MWEHQFWWTLDHLLKYNKKMEETFEKKNRKIAHKRSKFIASK